MSTESSRATPRRDQPPTRVSIERAYSESNLPYAYRSLFPITERCIYLNHAGAAPISSSTKQKMVNMIAQLTYQGSNLLDDTRQIHSGVRSSAARLVNAKPHQIAFVRNTSEGLSLIANGIAWRPGENIVSAAVEFPANLYPWQSVAALHGLELRLAREHEGVVAIEDLLALIDQRTRLVTISWVQFATGQILDIKRIGQFCRERQVLFVVDAIQGLGALELNVETDCVDAFACGAQKFLLGPKGIALVYLSDFALEQVQPTMIQEATVQGDGDFQCDLLNSRQGGNRFEGDTLNTLGICGLGAALDLFLQATPLEIDGYLRSLNSYLRVKLSERGYSVQSGLRPEEVSSIVVCRHDHFSADELCRSLYAQNIVVSARLGGLRISPHFYNTPAEVDALVNALPT